MKPIGNPGYPLSNQNPFKTTRLLNRPHFELLSAGSKNTGEISEVSLQLSLRRNFCRWVSMGIPCNSWTPNCHLGMKQLQVMIPAQMKALLPSQMTSVMSLSILLKKRRKRRMKTLGQWRKGTMQLIWKVASLPGWKMKCRFKNVNLRRWKSERGVVHFPPLPHPPPPTFNVLRR